MQTQQLSPNSLPIARHLPKIAQLIQTNPVVVISGKTGCGKSTQVPKTIWKHNPKAKIAVCQPRRVAATSLAIRVAEQVGCKIGSSIGYHIGMESFKSENCSIIYMTYGILIQQLLFQHQLPYTHIILDQIHQRSLQMDFSFVALKNLINQRKQQGKSVSKLIIMSATLDSQEFAKYFATHTQTGLFFIPTIKAVETEQRQYRSRGIRLTQQRTRRINRDRDRDEDSIVQTIQRSEMDQKYIEAAMYDIPEEKKYKVEEIFWKGDSLYSVSTCQQEPRLTDQIINQALNLIKKLKNDKNIEGDILFFLPGYYQIQTVKKKLLQTNILEERIVQVHSIFSQQLYQKLFVSKIKNKMILATKIGESSITLPFCNIVIDFCLTKVNTVRQKGINQLETRFASKSSLIQRSGRVGRVADGYVFRMITEKFYQTLPQYEQPQIKCISLQMVILRAKQLDQINNSNVFADPYSFLQGVMNPPKIEAVRSAISHLIQQQALTGPGIKIQQGHKLQLTKIGQFMVSMPCDMQISKMILMSIKLRIPRLVVAIASIMISTKMFFVHQERRENIEQFMHALIGYDSGLSNDYFLRERMYNHWKEKFYYPIKQKRLYKRKVRYTPKKQENEKEFSRKYEQDQQQAQEMSAFLQQFCQQKWSHIQKQFCFPRGLNLMTMRQIIKIEENLKLRLKKLGVTYEQSEKKNLNLFLLCLTFAFPDYNCKITYSKYIQNCKQDRNCIMFPDGRDNITDKMLDKYIDPQRDYQVKRKQRSIKIIGPPKVLKKFIFPFHFNKSSISKYVSYLYQKLSKQKIGKDFQCDISHNFSQVAILNEPINRVIIMSDYEKVYKLLTHQMSLSNYRKLVKMSAIIDQETYLLIQLITNKDVEVSLHPCGQFLRSFRIGDQQSHFKRIISEDELNIIKSLRNVAIRKNTNTIHSSQQLMSPKDIQSLLNFLQGSNMKVRQQEPWQKIFIKKNYDESTEKYYPLSYPFQFVKNNSFQIRYQEWKREQYNKYIDLYKHLVFYNYQIVCIECGETIESVDFWDPQKKLLKLNQYSGNWVQKDDDLCCVQGHVVGKIQQESQYSTLYLDKLQIQEHFNKRTPFWKKWPSKEELTIMTQRAKRQVRQFQDQINTFQCPFCFEKDNNDTLKYFSRSQCTSKKLREHFINLYHRDSLSKFKKSMRKTKQ